MRIHVSSWQLCVTLGALGGLTATAIATAGVVRSGSLVDAALSSPFNLGFGTIVGATVGHLLWVLLDPAQRVSRLLIVLVALNTGSWLLFIVRVPHLSRSEPDAIVQHRAELDREAAAGWPNGMLLVDHPPSLLLGRPFLMFGLAQKPIGLLAGLPILFVGALTVPVRHRQTGPTVRESYWIAAIAFVLSTAWWTNCASMWHRLRSVRKRAPVTPLRR